MKSILLALIAVLTSAPRENAYAQAFPSKPIRIIVPAVAGSNPDFRAR